MTHRQARSEGGFNHSFSSSREETDMDSTTQSRVDELRKRLGIDKKRSFSVTRRTPSAVQTTNTMEALSPLSSGSQKKLLSEPMSPNMGSKWNSRPVSPQSGLGIRPHQGPQRSHSEWHSPSRDQSRVAAFQNSDRVASFGIPPRPPSHFAGLPTRQRDAIKETVQLLEESRASYPEHNHGYIVSKGRDEAQRSSSRSLLTPQINTSPIHASWDSKVKDYLSLQRRQEATTRSAATPDLVSLYHDSMPPPFNYSPNARNKPTGSYLPMISSSPIHGQQQYDHANAMQLRASNHEEELAVKQQLQTVKSELVERSKRWDNQLAELMSKVNYLTERLACQTDDGGTHGEARALREAVKEELVDIKQKHLTLIGEAENRLQESIHQTLETQGNALSIELGSKAASLMELKTFFEVDLPSMKKHLDEGRSKRKALGNHIDHLIETQSSTWLEVLDSCQRSCEQTKRQVDSKIESIIDFCTQRLDAIRQEHQAELEVIKSKEHRSPLNIKHSVTGSSLNLDSDHRRSSYGFEGGVMQQLGATMPGLFTGGSSHSILPSPPRIKTAELEDVCIVSHAAKMKEGFDV